MSRCSALFSVAVVLACVSTAQALEMEWVTVGDAGNTPDDEIMWDGTTGYGAVPYVYNIGKYEVTNAQYCEFLNAVGASDPNGLYNVDMGSEYGGITRSGSAGSYTYAPIEGRGNMPVGYVSWYDTLRFANWMHNGQPTGAQDSVTTEDGTYDMSLGSDVVRKPGAQIFLPSEDEWYKAAYYKGGRPDAGYWDYPTQSDTPPMAEDLPGTDFVFGSANCDRVLEDLTYVGSYTAKPSDSAYGTFDQGGNVREWNEALILDVYRVMRGGAFNKDDDRLHAWFRYFRYPTHEYYNMGFRVAGVPVHDGDGDVDLDDFALFQAAFTGPR